MSRAVKSIIQLSFLILALTIAACGGESDAPDFSSDGLQDFDGTNISQDLDHHQDLASHDKFYVEFNEPTLIAMWMTNTGTSHSHAGGISLQNTAFNHLEGMLTAGAYADTTDAEFIQFLRGLKLTVTSLADPAMIMHMALISDAMTTNAEGGPQTTMKFGGDWTSAQVSAVRISVWDKHGVELAQQIIHPVMGNLIPESMGNLSGSL